MLINSRRLRGHRRLTVWHVEDLITGQRNSIQCMHRTTGTNYNVTSRWSRTARHWGQWHYKESQSRHIGCAKYSCNETETCKVRLCVDLRRQNVMREKRTLRRCAVLHKLTDSTVFSKVDWIFADPVGPRNQTIDHLHNTFRPIRFPETPAQYFKCAGNLTGQYGTAIRMYTRNGCHYWLHYHTRRKKRAKHDEHHERFLRITRTEAEQRCWDNPNQSSWVISWVRMTCSQIQRKWIQFARCPHQRTWPSYAGC